jgi:hypothetical protein
VTTSLPDTVTLGVQAGDKDVASKLEPYYMKLRRLLAKKCVGPYCPAVDEFAIVLRIDGSIWHWDFEGCKYLRLSKRKRYVTIDIGVPPRVSGDTDAEAVKRYLMDNVSDALSRMMGRLVERKFDVDVARMRNDLQAVSAAFLGGEVH